MNNYCLIILIKTDPDGPGSTRVWMKPRLPLGKNVRNLQAQGALDDGVKLTPFHIIIIKIIYFGMLSIYPFYAKMKRHFSLYNDLVTKRMYYVEKKKSLT